MKKIVLSLLALFLVIAMHAQVRILFASPAADSFTLKNFGTTTVDVSSHQICALFAYASIGSLTPSGGTTMLAPNDEVTFTGFSLNDASSDLGYYTTSNFSSPQAMLDFVQWGASGLGRESVAVSKGIWTAGDFLTSAGPFVYVGNGSANDVGITFWQISVGVQEHTHIGGTDLFPNPATNQLNVDATSVQFIAAARIISPEGKSIRFETLNSGALNRVDLSELKPGVYFLEVHTTKGMARLRFIKQ